jgi:tetratricopeptide (TPR) repeat protein
MTNDLIDLERRGLDLRNAGRLREAAELFSRIVEEQPDWEHGTGFYDLAVCYEDLGEIQLAEQAYKERAFGCYLLLLEVDRINKDDAGVKASETALRALGEKIGISQVEVDERINRRLV